MSRGENAISLLSLTHGSKLQLCHKYHFTKICSSELLSPILNTKSISRIWARVFVVTFVMLLVLQNTAFKQGEAASTTCMHL